MNMNMKLNLGSFDIKRIGLMLLGYRKLFITLAIVGLLGYTGYQISRITAVQPDKAYLDAKKEDKQAAVPNLRISKDVQERLRSLQSAGDTSIPVNVGKSNPFTLN
jgi:hypothetical protein